MTFNGSCYGLIKKNFCYFLSSLFPNFFIAATGVFLTTGDLAAQPIQPVYSGTYADDTTGNNSFVSSSNGLTYWFIDAPPGDAEAGADDYNSNNYERPTIQTFESVPHPTLGTVYASKQYFPYLDIIGGRIGKDDTYLYVSMHLFSTDHNGLLSEEYTLEIDADNDMRGDFLFVTDNPGDKNATGSYTQNAVFGFVDANGDVGGSDPLKSLSGGDTQDPGLMNGYELQFFADENPYFWVRIDPANPTIIEFAINHLAIGAYLGKSILPDGIIVKCGGADKGIQDNQNYLFHDKYTIAEAGTPYNDGFLLGNVYEYDNTRFLSTSGICDSSKITSHFTLLFEGVTYNDELGTSKWDYVLEWDGTPPELSYFFIELCSLLTNENLVAVEPDFGSIGFNGNAGLYGIKWDGIVDFPANTPIHFSFTLDQMLAQSATNFAPKAGVNQNFATICGPSKFCEEIESNCDDNMPPSVGCPNDTTITSSNLSEICLEGFQLSDPDNNISTVTVLGGEFESGRVCFIPTEGLNVIILSVVDSCGASAICTTNVFVQIKNPPVCLLPADSQTIQICAGEEICLVVTATDMDNDFTGCSVVSGPGQIMEDTLWCYTPQGNETVTVGIECIDSTGLICSGTFTVTFEIDSQPPVVLLGDDFSTQICGESQICIPFQVTDNNLSSVISNFEILGDSVCFTPDTSGTYLVWVRAVDGCERVSADTILITVSVPPAPFVDLGDDVNLTLCMPSQYCIDILTIDNPVSIIFNHEGYNPETGQFCFMPEVTFHDYLKVEVVDSCGRVANDSIFVILHFNSPPQIETALRDTTIYLCQPSYVCLDVEFFDYDNNISNIQVNRGTFSNGQICFVPYDSGNYTIIATATDSCGAFVSDTAVVRIITDQFVDLQCPNDTSVFMCEHDTLCFPIGEIPEWADVQVTGINTWYDRENQQVCFYLECGVSNRIVVKAITPCDTISCEFTVNVECNQPPVVALPPDTTVQLCGPDSIYFPVGINDPNFNLSSVEVSSWAVFEPITSRLAFYADTAGIYALTVFAYDSCGAFASDVILIRVNIDEPPVCEMPADTTIYLCQPGQITLPIYSSDSSQSALVCAVVEGPGEIVDGFWVYQADAGGIVNVVVECVDFCENVCRDSFSVEISLNDAPICDLPSDTVITQCQPTEICLPFYAFDTDGNLIGCSIISGPGSIGNPVGKVNIQKAALGTTKSQVWCYTPTNDTSFTVVIKCEDSCGTFCIDSFNVTVNVNEAPIVTCPEDTSLMLCSLSPVSISGFAATDADGNLAMTSVSIGQLVGDIVTFNPFEGENIIVISATDSCGAVDACTTVVNVQLNRAPVCQVPNDTTITGCAEIEVCLPVSGTDPDGNFAYCEIVSGPGQINNGYFCFVPETNDPYEIVIRCYDECGAYCEDTFIVLFDVGTAPAITNQYFSHKYCNQAFERTIQIVAGQSGFDATIYELLSGPGSIDTLLGLLTYQPDTPGVYSFIVEVSNSCGSNSAIIYDTVKINRPPEIIGFDSTLFLCQVQEICFDVFGFDSDLDSLDIQAVSGPGVFTQTGKNSGSHCFIPVVSDSAITYLFVFQVTDLCRENDEGPIEYFYDTVAITVILDKPPVLDIPPFFSIFACNTDSACFPIPAFDPEDFPYTVEVLSGNAVIYGDTVACLLIDGSGDYVVSIKITDSCGNSSTYSSTITVELNSPPVVNVPNDYSTEVCTAGDVCFEFGVSDIDGNPASITANIGEIGQGNVLCFEADSSGVYSIVITAVDSCGTSDVDTVNITVDLNQVPQVTLGQDSAIAICSIQNICLPYHVSDDNLAQTTSNVSILGDSLCFIADTSGTYIIWLEALDDCEVSVRDSIIITVATSPTPFANLGDDINAKICSATEFCIDLETIANPVSVEFNYDGYDSETRRICFIADETISEFLIVTVTDSCGKTATDSILVNIQLNSPPQVQLAMPDTTVYLCQPTYICLPLLFEDAESNIADIQVNRGNYADGQVCFVPYDSGTYTIIATATDSCGALVSDTAFVRVVTDQYVQLECPGDTTVFMCSHDTLCFPIGDIPEWADIQVTGINTWYDSETQKVCFYVTCGVRNRIVVRAITACDTISCSFDVTVVCNQPPVAFLPQDTIVNLCGPDSVRIPVGITDPNGNIASVITNSWAVYVPVTGRIGFAADSEGVYIVQVTVTDSCGAQDIENIAVTVLMNTPPEISFSPADSVFDFCTGREICLPISFSDRENNIVQIVPSTGYYNFETDEICISPGDTSGTFCLSVVAVDACGATDTAFKCIYLNNQGFVEIQCPSGPIYDTLCSADSICTIISIIGDPDSIKVSSGHFVDNMLCFQADTSGIYDITLTVYSPCTTLTCQIQYRVTINLPVYVLCPDNDTVLVCAPDTVFYTFASTSVTEFTITPPAFISGSTIRLPILSSGIYDITLIGSGACGADTCSFYVDATVNTPPILVSANDTTLSGCILEPFCIPFTVSDSEGNLNSVIGPNGPISGNEYCFTPTGSGEYRIILRAIDACGAVGVDTTTVRVSQTAADILCPTGTQNRTVCRGDSVRVTVPITPFEAEVQVFLDGISNGYYNRDSALVIVFPETPGSHTIRIIATAGCVEDTCDINLFINFLELTAITCPAVIDTFLCPVEIDSICFPVTVLGTNVQVTVSSGGRYSGGTVCVPISQEETIDVRIIGTGACGTDTCFTTINIIADDPPIMYLPQDTVISLCDFDTSTICIGGIFVEDDSSVSLTKICGPGTFTKIGTDSGFICFKPSGDFFGDYNFCFEVSDGCNVKIDTFRVTIIEGAQCNQCLTLTIDGGECIPLGGVKKVAVKIDSYRPIGGFELLISYDATVTGFSSAEITGTSIHGWEYFNYRTNSAACGSVCPSGIIRLVGLAETNNGANHPPDSTFNPNGVLLNLYFLVTNDQNVGGQFLPIRFVTFECQDNSFSDPTGNELYVDSRIFNNENILIWDEGNDVAYPESNRIFGLGTPDSCITGVGKGTLRRCIDFINGGICILHPDEIDDRGDLNLNGVSYEVADAVLFTNYFIYGLQVFTVNIAGQIAASDVNADGISLSVADLVLLIRIILGDAAPVPKINPHEVELKLSEAAVNGELEVSAESVGGIGGAYFVYNLQNSNVNASPELSAVAANMELRYHIEDNELRVLIISMSGASIEAGKINLFRIPYEGNRPTLTKVEFADRDGRPYIIAGKSGELPTGFELFQNYPNPFNPTTMLSFSLPVQSDWTLTVFNVNGATVRRFVGSNVAGVVEVFWDGRSDNSREVASGVYFYKLEAGKFNSTKKMIMLK